MTVMVSLHQSSKIDIFSELDIVLQRDGKKQLSWEKTTVDLYPIYSCLVFDVQFCVFFFFLFGWVFVFVFFLRFTYLRAHKEGQKERERESQPDSTPSMELPTTRDHDLSRNRVGWLTEPPRSPWSILH